MMKRQGSGLGDSGRNCKNERSGERIVNDFPNEIIPKDTQLIICYTPHNDDKAL